MKSALPLSDRFSYISVVDAICPAQRCPLTIDDGIPLAWDHAHLTAEGSVYVAAKLMTMIHFEK
jgi:SGNH domain (fused to AT3 domains)